MASRRASSIATQLARLSAPATRRSPNLGITSLQRPLTALRQQQTVRHGLASLCRFAHTIPRPPSATKTPDHNSADTQAQAQKGGEKKAEPHYKLTFTCVPCGERSSHSVSKQGYHHGSVLISCPGCRNRHVISDHLGIFGDKNITVEDLMRERGQLVKRGTLGEDGDLEFWEDGTVTPHEATVTKKGNATNSASDAEQEVDPSPPGASFKSASRNDS